MKKTLILASFLALAPFAKGQLLLEALEGGIPFTPSEKCLERVYDKYYGDGVHNYIYCAVQGPNGKKWLNLNLGAEYAKESSPHFNPEAVPTDYNDWKAFGNLYQWGRDSDGHEQVEYRQGRDYWEIRPINGVRSTRLEAGEQSNQVVADPNSNGYRVDLSDYWSDIYDPCPHGYHILRADELRDFSHLDKIEGGMQTTSTFSSISYDNIVIMTAPSTYFDTLPQDGWQKTYAKLKAEPRPVNGNSELWIGNSDKKLAYAGTQWHVWEELSMLNRGYFLTRGTYINFGLHHYAVGSFLLSYDRNDWTIQQNKYMGMKQMAIRCVQD